MDDYTLQNWEKIKALMELNGNTSNSFYKRACQITSGRPDPMDTFMNKGNRMESSEDSTDGPTKDKGSNNN